MGPVERWLGRIPKRAGWRRLGKLAACGERCVLEPGGAGRFERLAMDRELGDTAIAVLSALAHRAAEGKSSTIAKDWGFGSGTVIDETGAHTHVGADWHEQDEAALKAFIDGLHSLLCGGTGLSWVRPNEWKGLPHPELSSPA